VLRRAGLRPTARVVEPSPNFSASQLRSPQPPRPCSPPRPFARGPVEHQQSSRGLATVHQQRPLPAVHAGVWTRRAHRQPTPAWRCRSPTPRSFEPTSQASARSWGFRSEMIRSSLTDTRATRCQTGAPGCCEELLSGWILGQRAPAQPTRRPSQTLYPALSSSFPTLGDAHLPPALPPRRPHPSVAAQSLVLT
jgi:hypothetical protein